ncbi:MAG: hypothetical protein PHX87_00710 [Candidatus Peribacteraceae bacterium]|nr:hypothetical protein [Candidatus Peribacteraceae bacterium]MDD5741929.1 hypothetical protein [Candidatus Peribacteraceae bacterium]
MFGFTREEMAILRPLKTPRKIQDFLDTLAMNFEPEGDTCRSPRLVLQMRQAHCMEGAMLAAVALRIADFRPLVMDLKATDDDEDHVVALFIINNHWGALSKTNHGVLRYREPVYRTVRELALSYFHEYFLSDGRKTLRSYSVPVDLSRFDAQSWMTDEEDVWYIPEFLDNARHFPILSKAQIAGLRRADPIEREKFTETEWAESPQCR